METYRHVSQIINTNLNHTKGLLAPENTPYALPFTFLRGAKPGPVGIDESSSFSEETLRQNAENLKERGVVYTAQSIDKAAKVAANLPNRRVLLIMIGKT